MIKTNRDSLLELAAVGEITSTVVDPTYMTTWNGEPIVGMGRGGIVYNIKVGDSCFRWAWGDKAEPGVSADGIGNDREKGSFRNYPCIGNPVRVVGGEAKNEMGVVVGKVGYLPGRSHHVVMHFKDETLDKLSIGDKVQVRTCGIGLKFMDYPGVRVVGLSPQLLDAMGLDEADSKIRVSVVKVIPPEYVGQGSGGAPVESSNWDVMTQSPDALEELKDLKLGDIVMLKDILSAWGRGYYEGGATIGVVSCGASNRMGQGIGVTVLFTSKEGEIEPVIDPEANIGKHLGLEGN